MNTEKLYYIECRTGCTCCRCENHLRGMFITKESAERRVELFKKMPLLSSQYSSTGVYTIVDVDIKATLEDGTILVASKDTRNQGRWFDKDYIFDTDKDGYLLDPDSNMRLSNKDDLDRL